MEMTLEYTVNLALSGKEFNLMTRCLQGNVLSEADKRLALELNVKLIQGRLNELRHITKQAKKVINQAEYLTTQAYCTKCRTALVYPGSVEKGLCEDCNAKD